MSKRVKCRHKWYVTGWLAGTRAATYSGGVNNRDVAARLALNTCVSNPLVKIKVEPGIYMGHTIKWCRDARKA